MDSEPSLRGTTLRHVAVVLGGTLAFLGLLCGIMLVVSVATSKKESSPQSTSAATDRALESPPAASPADGKDHATKAKKPSI